LIARTIFVFGGWLFTTPTVDVDGIPLSAYSRSDDDQGFAKEK
jgi:hypothetical protein